MAKLSRRGFLRTSGLTLGSLGLPLGRGTPLQQRGISIVADPSDQVVASASCRWAMQELKQALIEQGIKVQQFNSLQQASSDGPCIVATSSEQQCSTLLKGSRVVFPKKPESLALAPFAMENRHGTLAYGDSRGLMYALLDLVDRVRQSDRPAVLKEALELRRPSVETPRNPIRSVGRIFCSDIEDKPWFYDRDMWPEYFSMLATHRFNRFSLNFGVGYDFLDNVSDAYFLFVYPFLLPVAGYKVRAVNLPDEERDRNLEMLQLISEQCVAHGIDFQLGIWTHGYKWGPASKPNYTIEGITPENHAAYSRDALTALLVGCPNISGITLRTHGESGVHEGSYEFWSTIFSALPASGRTVKLDLHTKGLNQELIDAALRTGVPLTLSPKYWAEHMGLPYQQAAIRELEMPHDENREGFFSLSSGSRSFTRYGYADFLREDRPYKVIYRIWPGSHRLLLWGDPSAAAAHARAFNFCGCDGVELFEPLSLKGRRGSGIAGNRCAYADTSLVPRWDWQKYLYTYRVWGQLMYNPDAAPNIWQRYLQKHYGDAAQAIESALASATAITSIVTTAHLPSAANETFNPEYYTNQPIVDASRPSPYGDTPAPKVFGNVSPLDPQLFSSCNEFVGEILSRKRSAKYSPLEVARWLDDKADSAASHLREAAARVMDKNSPEFRRAAIDLEIQIGIGHFFAAKFRSAVLYAIYEQSGDRNALEQALQQYGRAREIWQRFAENAEGSYLSDITFGTEPHQRGNWVDRLPSIDEDIADMKKRFEAAAFTGEKQNPISLSKLLAPPRHESIAVEHTPPPSFGPGRPLTIVISVPRETSPSFAIHLCYRHVNQAERYQSVEMRGGGTFTSTIPANYTVSKFPLQYYFEIRDVDDAWLFPGLGKNLQSQPYFVVRPE